MQVLAFYFESGAAAGAQGGIVASADGQLDGTPQAAAAASMKSPKSTSDSPLAITSFAAVAFPLGSSASAELGAPSATSSPSPLLIPKHSPLSQALQPPLAPTHFALAPSFPVASADSIKTSNRREIDADEELHDALDAGEGDQFRANLPIDAMEGDGDWASDEAR